MTGFRPQTHLEQLLVRAFDRPTDAAAYRGFATELMNVVLGVLGRTEPHGFQPLVLSPLGSPGVCVFSHPSRFETFGSRLMLPGPGWEVRPEPARRLFEWAVGNELTVLLNPGSDYGKDFPAFELDRFLRGQWV
ncbi:MAG: hypothetical protein QM582_06790 [Micropruina sp.]|uniref:hypothetical protein n=1 Tax=Micropruina sp. TaxID=2737536 RepID=UPI0039E3AFC2